MNWAGYPTLNSLRAFSTLAETLSFSRAADELNVTHAAVSQQIKILEDRLGLTLVERKGKAVRLTTQGKALALDLAEGFNIIYRGVESLSETASARAVQVTMTPALAVSYLMPGIADFQLLHPGITLMLNPTAEVVDLSPEGIDVAIRYCDGEVPGMEVSPLIICDMVVVGARELVGERDLTDPATLCDLPWLQELGTDEVAEWMTRRGVKPGRPIQITHMPGSLIMDAVRRGHGITYTARKFVEDDLRSGHLVELYSERDSNGYYLVTRPGMLRPSVRIFLDWIKAYSRQDSPDSEPRGRTTTSH
jgi:LysR family glycine cleavage system transcriptional activator